MVLKNKGVYMKTASVNNSPNFGHSFRVSICLKGENGLENVFVNPASDEKLYKTLNAKIVNWLNEGFYTGLRNTYGVQRKVSKKAAYGNTYRQMADNLRQIDSDYADFGLVRSVYRRNALALIATGSDVPIIENLKGAKNIGVAKSDSIMTYGHSQSDYVKALTKAVRDNILSYITSDNVLLRSKNNKEIMLKTIFRKVGKNKYELDSFEFHENRTKPDLKPVTNEFNLYKSSANVSREIRNTIQHHVNKLFGIRRHCS